MTQRLKQYGLSVSEFTALLAAQEGKCPVCDECLPNEPHLIHIDHSHATGKVRGILCRLCNIGLGYFQDDTARMERAIQYVSKSK